MDESHLEVLESALHQIEYGEWPAEASINSRHERIKADVVRVGLEFGYRPIPEFNPTEGSGPGQKRVDVGWFDGEQCVAAIEIDGTVKKPSVEKLQTLGDDVFKVIISKSTNQTRIRRMVDEKLPEDFHHIDLGLYEHF